MTVKDIWTERDYDEMGWHDSRIYSLVFPDEKNFALTLDIDYIFKWVLVEEKAFNFWVSPCTISFFSVSNLNCNLQFGNQIGIDILDLEYSNVRLTPNGKRPMWDFEIITGVGTISFSSTGYEQKVMKQPVFTDGQFLGRG